MVFQYKSVSKMVLKGLLLSYGNVQVGRVWRPATGGNVQSDNSLA